MMRSKRAGARTAGSSAGTSSKANISEAGVEHLRRVRRICTALPEVAEKLSHDEPTFFVKKKVFAMFSNNHHNDGHISVLIPAAPGMQPALIRSAPETFYRPPYVGVKGWVGIELKAISDEDLATHILEAWTLIAAKKVQNGVRARHR